MKKKLLIAFTLGLLIAPICTLTVFSQPPPPGGATAAPTCWPPPCVPIDGGISFLIAAGIGLGVKKANDYRKRS